MISLLRRYLAPYRGRIALVLALLLVQAIGNLYRPTLNGDIINEGVANGDTDYIVRVGGLMLVFSLALGVTSILGNKGANRGAGQPPRVHREEGLLRRALRVVLTTVMTASAYQSGLWLGSRRADHK